MVKRIVTVILLILICYLSSLTLLAISDLENGSLSGTIKYYEVTGEIGKSTTIQDPYRLVNVIQMWHHSGGYWSINYMDLFGASERFTVFDSELPRNSWSHTTLIAEHLKKSKDWKLHYRIYLPAECNNALKNGREFNFSVKPIQDDRFDERDFLQINKPVEYKLTAIGSGHILDIWAAPNMLMTEERLHRYVPNLAPNLPLFDETLEPYLPYISNAYAMYEGATKVGVAYGSYGFGSFSRIEPPVAFPLLAPLIRNNAGFLFSGNTIEVRGERSGNYSSQRVRIGDSTFNGGGAVGYYYYFPIEVQLYAEPPPPPKSVNPVGDITFDPPSCNWTNRPLPVDVTVNGIIEVNKSDRTSRSYNYSSTIPAPTPAATPFPSPAPTPTTINNSDSTTWGYEQDFSASPVRVSGHVLASSPQQTAIRTGTISVGKDGVGTLSAALSGWSATSASWDAGSPPQGSWGSASAPGFSAPTETYASTSGIYRIDLTKPIITLTEGGEMIYQPNNTVHVSLNDNLAGISETRALWSQAMTEPLVADMQTVPYSTPEFTGTDSTGAPTHTGTASFNHPIHGGMKRLGAWYLHVYARDRAGNESRQVLAVDVQVKLQGFRITDVTDLGWEKLFWEPDARTGVHKDAWYFPAQMPVLVHPETKQAARIGSAFHFSVDSLGMNEDVDEIGILPRYYYIKDLSVASINSAYEVDLYYNQGTDILVPYGDSIRDKWVFTQGMLNGQPVAVSKQGATATDIGGHGATDGSGGLALIPGVRSVATPTQARWYGKYGLMLDTVALRKGTPIVLNGRLNDSQMLKKGYLLVNFTIDAYKDGVRVFSYIPDTWNLEGGPSDRNLWYAGDIMVFNLGQKVTDVYVPGGDR